jgi:hypothetical protein
MTLLSRRSFLVSSAVLLAPTGARAAASTAPGFPSQEPQLVEEMVVVAHGNVTRVKELVRRQPTLAKATWDWGFGDWETALGAASHVGSREIAELLLANGAHPTIFSAAMLGQIDVVKAFVAAAPGVQRTRGPHSISLLRHAMAGGPRAQKAVEYLESIEGADDKPAEAPLSEADITKLAGTYTFGVTPADRVEITANNMQLQFGRPGRFSRGLFHLGSYEFCPIGAENVRVRFSEAGGSMIVTVHDPDIVLTARKSGA